MKNIDVFKTGKILEKQPYYSFETEDYTDVVYLIQIENKLYQVVFDSNENILEPDEECIPIVDDIDKLDEETDENSNNLYVGMTSDSGMSLSSLYENIIIMENFEE